MNRIILLLAVCLALSPAAVLVESAPYTSDLGYTVELPDNYDSTRIYPLIVAIHGYGDQMGAYAGTNTQLYPEGAVGLYPESPFPFENEGKIGWTWWLWADSASGMSQQSTKEQSINWILAASTESRRNTASIHRPSSSSASRRAGCSPTRSASAIPSASAA